MIRFGRKGMIALLSSMVGFAAMAAVSVTVAWFQTRVNIDLSTDLVGGTAGSFFAYGNGKPLNEQTGDRPYGITKARHLYNLAWLQDIGYFETKSGGHPTLYFELGADIDMSEETALPPIGTEAHPFVGNFDGNGHTVHNLVVSNDMSDFDRHPYIVKSIADIGSPKIVGFFGVVGRMVDQSFEYSSATNIIADTALLNITVKSATSQTLVGLAGGYVNGTLSNVAVNGSRLYTKENATPLTYTSNVSDYSLVGYATSGALGTMNLRSDDADIPLTQNPNTAQGGDNWGGSINMLEMYTFLRHMVADVSTPYSFVTQKEVNVAVDGTETTRTLATATNGYYGPGSFSEYVRYHGAKTVLDDKEYASFSFARTSDEDTFNPYNSDDTKYVCLYGGVTGKQAATASSGSTNNATKTTTTKTTTKYNGNVITDNAGHFLRVTGTGNGGVTSVTTPQTGCYFTLDGNGYLKTTTGETYYLYNDSGSIRGNNTSSNNNNYKWTYDATNHRLSVAGGTYYLCYSGSWGLVSSTSSQTYYSFSSGGKYLNANGMMLEYSSGNNTKWYADGSNYYTMIDGVQYYICISGSNVVLSNNGDKLQYGSNKLYYRTGWWNYTYYAATVSGSSFVITSGSSLSNVGTSFTRNGTSEYTYTAFETQLTDTAISVSATSTNATYDTNATYFPLTRDLDADGNYTADGVAGKPDEKNTGYVISGANLSDSGQAPYGDIRVARFETSDISVALSGSSSYSDSKLEVVTRTCVKGDNDRYVDSGWTRISDDYNAGNTASSTLSGTFSNKKNYKTDLRLNKYKSSRSQLGSTLSTGGGGIYGLHFMNAQISSSRLVTGKNVVVMDGKRVDGEGKAIGSEYTDYPMPQDCIDFHLKDQGFINFFAGTYFKSSGSWNDTFFSLHKITRAGDNTITDISEIKQIYAPSSGEVSAQNPYLYSYNGNKPSGAGDLVFDVSWITNPTMVNNAVYYFEIPVNSGEYALGSVYGKAGAYLMYLDIGAGVANYKEIKTTEKVVTTMKTAKYPLGVDFHPITVGSSWTEVSGGASAAVALSSGQAQKGWDYLYATANSGNTLTVSCEADPPISVAYEARGVAVKKTVSGVTGDLTFTPPTRETVTMEREGVESFNVFTSVVTHAVTDTYTLTGGATGDKFQLAKPVVRSGYSIDTAITYQKESGNATVDQNGLITRTGSGEVVVTMTYSEIQTGVDTWTSASEIVTDNTMGTIFRYHFRDTDNPNATVRYVYDPVGKSYTLFIASSVATVLDIDALPPTGYTVVINDGTSQTTLTKTSEITFINIAVS